MVAAARGTLRGSDRVARLGGDEFVVLLPETGAEQARIALEKLRARLLAAMAAQPLPVTFSIGAVVCASPVPGVDEVVRVADGLMYDVKRAGKNGLRVIELPAAGTVPPAPTP